MSYVDITTMNTLLLSSNSGCRPDKSSARTSDRCELEGRSLHGIAHEGQNSASFSLLDGTGHTPVVSAARPRGKGHRLSASQLIRSAAGFAEHTRSPCTSGAPAHEQASCTMLGSVRHYQCAAAGTTVAVWKSADRHAAAVRAVAVKGMRRGGEHGEGQSPRP